MYNRWSDTATEYFGQAVIGIDGRLVFKGPRVAASVHCGSNYDIMPMASYHPTAGAIRMGLLLMHAQVGGLPRNTRKRNSVTQGSARVPKLCWMRARCAGLRVHPAPCWDEMHPHRAVHTVCHA